MAVKASGGLIAFGVLNIIVAVIPICAGCIGAGMTASDQRMNLNGRELGPELKRHVEQNVPGATAEAVIAALANGLFGALLIGGAIGLFMAQGWARWLTIGAALLLVLSMCVHDIYQLALYRPAVNTFLDMNLRNMPPAERTGFKAGFTASYFFWSCFNPLLMVYLFVMCICLTMTSAFDKKDGSPPRRRDRSRVRDADDDVPRVRRRNFDGDEYEDDDRPPRRARGYDDD